MLKLTYTENGFYLERLSGSLEEWVTSRVMLALRAASSLWVESSTASFLLPADMPQLADLEKAVRQQTIDDISLSICDADFIEVTLKGNWMTSNPNGEEGVFVVNLSDRTEFFLSKLWQDSQTYASVTNE
ncbi:alr0857 family protein [Coleofasciculus sp. G2-EDA-02]|uniref:alr0857 family protein n=1 Tax=Coleofasciculus sp. G2-EDA-02 TaxID=3069529 RepID=UPI0032F8702D